MKFDNYMDPRKTFGKAVTQEAEKNEDIVVLSADSGKSSGFGEFIEKYPDRYFECGIMEQGVIGISSGLATTGKVPVFCAIALSGHAFSVPCSCGDTSYSGKYPRLAVPSCVRPLLRNFLFPPQPPCHA